MTDSDKFVEDDTEGVPAPCAPCNKCAFTHNLLTRKHERDIYHGGSHRPTCPWHTEGVPPDILKCRKECRHFAEKTER